MFEMFRSFIKSGFMKNEFYYHDHSKNSNWYRKTFERPRRKKRKK